MIKKALLRVETWDRLVLLKTSVMLLTVLSLVLIGVGHWLIVGDVFDPGTGEVAATDTTTAAAADTSIAVPTELVSGRAGDTKVFGALAVAELLAIILAPGAGAVYFKRRQRRRQGAAA